MMTSDQRLCAFDISVVVSNGNALLTGKVSSEAERRRAEELARRSGASGVSDRLIIDPSAAEPEKC